MFGISKLILMVSYWYYKIVNALKYNVYKIVIFNNVMLNLPIAFLQ